MFSMKMYNISPSAVVPVSPATRRGFPAPPSYPHPMRQQQQQQQQQTLPTQEQEIPKTHEMPWGKPTWIFLHTLAEKVKEEHFLSLRKELLEIVYGVCSNLPCPTCSEHATKYMKDINFNAINTKEKLKRMLFDFHNAVNKRKHAPLFPYAELSKYESALFKPVIYEFMRYFAMKTPNVKFLAEDLHRERLVFQMKTWFKNHIQYFDLEGATPVPVPGTDEGTVDEKEKVPDSTVVAAAEATI